MTERLAIFPSLDELSKEVADRLSDIADEAIASRGVMRIALAGGSTPRQLYRTLAGLAGIDWSKWAIYFGDERMVPSDDKRSNYAMACETLLDHVPLNMSQVYMPQVELGGPDEIASDYERIIRKSFNKPIDMPRFDIILLGLGSDGHTASLFPGKRALAVSDRLVVGSTPGILPPPVDRITFTLPLINAARNIFFLASGADKAPALQATRANTSFNDVQQTPASLVHPDDGNVDWFVTENTVE